MSGTEEQLIAAARELSVAMDKLRFAPPVTHVYNPLTYAWPAHELYLRRFGRGPKAVVFLGMNPGPFGMVQTGIPFGEIRAVRDWLGITARISAPKNTHPKRPVQGFDCVRSEVSGQRLWKLFADRFGSPEKFFADHFVANYCPLAFFESSQPNRICNRTPDKLPATEKETLFHACDAHLKRLLEILQPKWIIGVGNFAAERATEAAKVLPMRVGQILHPSPASPAANRNWAGTATTQLKQLGIWK